MSNITVVCVHSRYSRVTPMSAPATPAPATPVSMSTPVLMSTPGAPMPATRILPIARTAPMLARRLNFDNEEEEETDPHPLPSSPYVFNLLNTQGRIARYCFLSVDRMQ